MQSFLNIVLCTMLFISTLLAQKTKTITDNKNKEIYSVLKSDKNIRHGFFEKYSYKNNLLVSGFYKNGLKDSVWTYYNYEKEITQRYDFRSNSFEYLNEDISKYNLVCKNLDHTKPEISFDRPPLYIGGSTLLYNTMGNIIKYPADAQRANKSGTVEIKFVIDEKGDAKDFVLVKKLGYGLDEESMRVLKEFSVNSLFPAIYKNEKISTTCIFPVTYKLD